MTSATLATTRNTSIVSRLEVYSTFVHIAFLKMLAYRLRYVTGIITYLMFVSVNYFIWQAIFADSPAGTLIKGFTLSEMITYVAMGWVARSLYFSNIDVEMNELVISGEISAYLIRPVRFHLMMLSQALGETLFRLCFFTLPIFAVLLVLFPIQAPASILHGFSFLLSTFFSFLIFAEINFLVGLLAFVLKSIQGVMRAKYFFIQLFSGLLLPLTFFPEALQLVLKYLPFQLIAYAPLELYLGKKEGTQILETFATQLCWFFILLLVSRFFWKRAVIKLTVQGG